MGEPLGKELSLKDTRRIKSSLAWKEIIEGDSNFSQIEKRILHEMAIVTALPLLVKSQEDIKIVRRNVLSKLCEEDENFARQYILSLMKEIKYINKQDRMVREC